MSAWVRVAVVAYAAVLAVAVFGCDDPPGLTAAPAAAPAASATPPTPEKIAGVEGGAVRICAVAPGVTGNDLSVAVRGTSGESASLTLQKTDKGFCAYTKPELSWTGGTYLKVTPDAPSKVDELGLYYLRTWKENPTFDDLTYVKAGRVTDDPAFYVYVTKISATVPRIEIPAKE